MRSDTLADLAPDQRAVLELVLRQGRAYGELALALDIPERAVRERAEAGLRALAGDPGPEVDASAIADWLLGQRGEPPLSPDGRAWASRAARRLRAVGGERVPRVSAPSENGEAPRPRPRPRRAATSRGQAGTAAAAAPSAAAGADASGDARPAAGALARRPSKLGGAILVGVLLALVAAAVLIAVLTGGDDENSPAAEQPTQRQQPQASNTPAATGNDVVLRGSAGSEAAGLLRLFKTDNGQVQFGIGAQNMPQLKEGESYAVWFRKRNGQARLLGFPQTTVGEDGVFTAGGPKQGDEDAFPRWFATYDTVLVTRETTSRPKEPGPAVLQGTLPHGESG